MENNNDFYFKYLKYKSKYLKLKNDLEGGKIIDIFRKNKSTTKETKPVQENSKYSSQTNRPIPKVNCPTLKNRKDCVESHQYNKDQCVWVKEFPRQTKSDWICDFNKK